MKRTLLILMALLIAAILATGALWFWRDRQARSFYTDGSRISQRIDEAFVREVLWQPPEALLGGLNTEADEYEPRVSLDGSTLLLVRGKAGSNADIFIAHRDPATGSWDRPQPLIDINTEHDELGPSLSPDGRTLLFASNRPGSIGGYDLWLATRSDFGWSQPVNLGPEINSEYNEYGPSIGGPDDGAMLLFTSNRPAAGEAPTRLPDDWSATVRERYAASDYDLYGATLKPDGFEKAVALNALNSTHNEGAPAFSPAGDFLYFCSDRPGGAGGFDLYRSRRLDGAQLPPEPLGGDINTSANEMDPSPEMAGFALLFSTDRMRALDAKTGGSPGYDLWRSESREVFKRVGPRSPLDLAGLWAWLSPLLLWLLLLLLGVTLLGLSWKGVRSHRLSLLVRCLLASIIAHLMLMILMTFWQVTNTIAQMVEQGSPTRIVLVGETGGGGLVGQLRGGVSGVLDVAPREVAASIKAERVETSPGTAAELVRMGMDRAAAGQEEASQLEARSREADDRHVQTPESDVRTYAAIAQPSASDVVTPRDARRENSTEATALARGEDAPGAARSDAPPPLSASDAAQAALAPDSAQPTAAESVRIAARADEAAVSMSADASAPRSDQSLPTDPIAAQPSPVASLEEAQRIVNNETTGPAMQATGDAGAQRAATNTARSAANQSSGGGAAVAVAPQLGGVAQGEAGAPVDLRIPGDSTAPASTNAPAAAVASSAATEIGNAVTSESASIALPSVAGGSMATGAEAGAIVSASDAQDHATSARADVSAASAQPSAGDGTAAPVRTSVASGSAGGATEAMNIGEIAGVRDSDSRSANATGSTPSPASSLALQNDESKDAAGGDPIALPTDGAAGGAVAAGPTSQPGVGPPASVLAGESSRRAAIAQAGTGAESGDVAAMVAMAPAANGGIASSDESASIIANGGASARDATPGDTSAVGAPSRDHSPGLDDGGSLPALAAGELQLPNEGAANAGGDSEGEAALASGPAAASVASARSDRDDDAATFAGSGRDGAVALAPDRMTNPAGNAANDVAPGQGGSAARDADASGQSGTAAPGSDRSLGLDDDGLTPSALAAGEIQLPGGDSQPPPGATRAGDHIGDGPQIVALGAAAGKASDNGDASAFAPIPGSRSIALAPDRDAGGAGDESRDASPTQITGEFSDGDSISGTNFAPIAAASTDLALPDAAPGSDLSLRLPKDLMPAGSPYSARKEDTRLDTVKKMGGSEQTEKAVALALDWLARHQSPDGRWATRQFDEGCDKCGGEGKFDTDIATTGLALLCFLGADHTHLKDSKYQANVEKGLRWLLNHQEPNGDLRGGETMYSHGIASIAIAESLGMTGDPRLRDPVRRAVEFIDAARNRNTGGWRYEPRQAGDTSVAGWQVMALMSARRAGEATPDECFAAASAWMEQVGAPNRPGRYAYQPGQPASPSMTAEGLFIQQLLGVPRNDPRMMGSVAYILENLPRWDEAANTYYWYYATLAMFQHQGPAWERWNKEITRVLLDNQRTSGTASGSWDPQDNWSTIGGRVYQTAIATLCLEVYYRYLPMYRNTLLADARGMVGGVVTDAKTGQPLVGATVVLDMSGGTGALVATTDLAGRYALDLPELPADFVALSASMEQYTPATTNISKAEATAAAGGEITHNFALDPRRTSVIALEEDPQVHHLGNDEFEGAINSQFQKSAEGVEYSAEFTLGPANLPPRVHKAEIVLMFKGAQAQNSIFINDRRLRQRLNGAPADGSFGEYRQEIPLVLLQEGVNRLVIRASSSAGDLDDFEFVNVQIQFDAEIPATATDEG